ncbi:ABC transporter permease [Leucobacter sp. cx-42]|uniref:ABC transporter permease n=1 Tax=unclassified Leucobacter TaxID=2621730 RepID=UPI00165E8AB3|nr:MULTISPECIES: ABC transporter permease [unclassified Leucobacter]MBC9954085.1 ABC transporter permease [Leucobacter sp. cx-42]
MVKNAYAPRSAFVELATASAKDLYRDKKGSFSILFMFVFFLLLILGLNYTINVSKRVDPVVAIGETVPSAVELETAFRAAGIEIAQDLGRANVTVQEAQGNMTILLSSVEKPIWIPIIAVIESIGVPAEKLTVQDDLGDPYIDLLRTNLPALSALGLMAIAFMGTSVPLTRMRENGSLRLLGTTPVSKLTFILAQTPIRLIYGLVVIGTIFGVAAIAGYAQGTQLPRLLLSMTLGLTVFFALAYLVAARSRRAETVNNVAAILPVTAILASGQVLPPQLLPIWLTWAMNALPTTWYTRVASADLTSEALNPGQFALYWGLMGGTAICAAMLSARLFVWDDRER